MLGGADNPNGELPSYITGADNQSDIITRQHLQEAVSYRAIDRLLIHLQKLLT